STNDDRVPAGNVFGISNSFESGCCNDRMTLPASSGRQLAIHHRPLR
ncbi:hypothetical protein RCH12_003633, partial [Cryobacterium sp. MP_3.1]|nr:hypothetical protein [Cryobacterium sp. MP_3.1]